MIELASFLSGSLLYFAFIYFPRLVITAFVSAMFYSISKKHYLPAFLLLIGFAYPFIRAIADEPALPKGPSVVEGHFNADSYKTKYGFAQTFKYGSGSIAVYSDKEFSAGRDCKLKIDVIRPARRLNPGQYQRRAHAVLISVLGEGAETASIGGYFQRAREKINAKVMAGLGDGNAASFVLALTTGKRSGMGRELTEAFNRSGLVHMLSVSGTHFGLFSILLFGMFRLLFAHLPMAALEPMTRYITPRQAAVFATLPAMGFYLGISGASVPALRSFFMIGLFLLGILIGRRGAWLNFTLCAATVLVLINPEVLSDTGFQLSFLAVIFMGFGLEGNVKTEENRNTNWLADSASRYAKTTILITFYATLGVLPIVAYRFHNISLIAPLSNLIATPVICFLLLPLSVIGSMVYLACGYFPFLNLIKAISDVSIMLTMKFAGFKYSSVHAGIFPAVLIAVYYAGFLAYWAFRKRVMIYAVLSIFAFYVMYALYAQDDGLMVTYLDAGRADVSVVECGGRTIFIDTGSTGGEASQYMRMKGIEKVDAVIISHSHKDHSGGLGRILEDFAVSEVWDSGLLKYPVYIEGVTQRHLKRGDIMHSGCMSITALHPYDGFYSSRGNKNTVENNGSLVVRIKSGESSFLFAGDIEAEAQQDLTALGDALKSDVLKIPHHGLRSGLYVGFYSAVNPSIAVASERTINKETAGALGGAKVYATGRHGAVCIRQTKEGLKANAYRDYILSKNPRSYIVEAKNIKKIFMSWP